MHRPHQAGAGPRSAQLPGSGAPPEGPPEGFVPGQRVDLEMAIRAYTLNGAYANFAEQNRGSITVGKYADLVLLSANLFEIPHQEILDAKVVLTMIGGSVVYRAP